MGSHMSPAPQTGTVLTCKYRWNKTTEAQGIWAALQSRRDQWQCARMLTQATAQISAVTRDSSTTSCRDLSSQNALQPYWTLTSYAPAQYRGAASQMVEPTRCKEFSRLRRYVVSLTAQAIARVTNMHRHLA